MPRGVLGHRQWLASGRAQAGADVPGEKFVVAFKFSKALHAHIGNPGDGGRSPAGKGANYSSEVAASAIHVAVLYILIVGFFKLVVLAV